MTLETVYEAIRSAQSAPSDTERLTRLTIAVEALTNAVAGLEARVAHQRDIMTPDEAAAFLGVSIYTLRRYYADGEPDPLPVHRPSERQLIFLRDEVLAWLKRR